MTLYARRDTVALGEYYTLHMEALQADNLCRMSAIAAELAWRDAQIERLTRDLNNALDEVQRLRFALSPLLSAISNLESIYEVHHSTALAWMEVWGATEIAKGLLCSDPSSTGATP